MYYYKARIYSPTLGRFLQTDPIGYGDGLNWYNYVGGDPVNATDPSGFSALPVDVTVNGRRGNWWENRCDGPNIVQCYILRGTGGSLADLTFAFSGNGAATPQGGDPVDVTVTAKREPQSDACGSTNSALDIVRNGAEWLSLGADGLSILATTTGFGAPIGSLVKGVQIGLEVGIAGINIYEQVQSGNFSGAFGQAAGRLSTVLIPGAKIGNRIRASAALNWGQHANGRLRQGFHHKIAGQNQAIDTLNGQVVGSAAQGGACLVR